MSIQYGLIESLCVLFPDSVRLYRHVLQEKPVCLATNQKVEIRHSPGSESLNDLLGMGEGRDTFQVFKILRCLFIYFYGLLWWLSW